MDDGDRAALVAALRRVGDTVRDLVVGHSEAGGRDDLARVASEEESDTQYVIDKLTEDELADVVQRELSPLASVTLVAEGFASGDVFLQGAAGPPLRLLVDPIDGTRGLMHQKRPAWVLMALAPDRGDETCLSDTVVAVQNEIPLVKQHLCDQLWWSENERGARRFDRVRGHGSALSLRPARGAHLEHGFATVCRFFPGNHAPLGAFTDRLYEALFGVLDPSRAICFEDQYVSTGGQLYELIAGHDRLVVDARPLLGGERLACHPYDICTAPIARAYGVALTDLSGRDLDAPYDTTSEIGWIGYGNEALRERIEPLLLPLLESWFPVPAQKGALGSPFPAG